MQLIFFPPINSVNLHSKKKKKGGGDSYYAQDTYSLIIFCRELIVLEERPIWGNDWPSLLEIGSRYERSLHYQTCKTRGKDKSVQDSYPSENTAETFLLSIVSFCKYRCSGQLKGFWGNFSYAWHLIQGCCEIPSLIFLPLTSHSGTGISVNFSR